MSERTAIFTTDFINQFNNLQISDAINTPVGSILQFAGLNPPVGWLLCDGSEVLKSSFVKLYNVIGDLYGVPCSPDKFVLPNLCGRVSIGSGLTDGLTSRALGDTGGEEIHELTTCELPAHSHCGTTEEHGSHDHTGITESAGRHHHIGTTDTSGSHNHGGVVSSVGNHSHGGSTQNSGGHTHSSNATGGSGYGNIGLAFSNGYSTRISVDETEGEINLDGTAALTINSVSDHSHSISADGGHDHTVSTDGTHTHTFTTECSGCHSHEFTTGRSGCHSHDFVTHNTGRNNAHNNMQPYIVLHHIIKF